MSKKLFKHPIFQQADEISTLCAPLKALGITYFAEVIIDQNKQFSAIGNNPRFAEVYFNNKYYNADIHLVEKNILGRFVVWDSITRCGNSEKLYIDSIAHGVNHTFTVIEKSHMSSHFYHFASATSGREINQSYLKNFDLIRHFINYFKQRTFISGLHAQAHSIKFGIDHSIGKYQLSKESEIFINDQNRLAFLEALRDASGEKLPLSQISPRERDCLELTLKGKTAKEIAWKLNISYRTVEEYLTSLKRKLGVKTKSQLYELWYSLFV